MAAMKRNTRARPNQAARLLKEPTVHFFIIAAAILFTHRLAVGDPRVIVITPALKGDLLRRYQDQLSRPPTSGEADSFMRAWKEEEALYREALREGLDRDDPTVRNVLISKMRDRVALQARMPEPTEAELQHYFEQHRDQFEAPMIYEHEYVAFPKSEVGAERERAKYERLLKADATTASLGLHSTAAKVNRERIEQQFGPETADRICHLPIGQWQELETNDRLLLVKMIEVQGGLPEPQALHARLLAGWQAIMGQKAVEQATHVISDRYRFEEPAR